MGGSASVRAATRALILAAVARVAAIGEIARTGATSERTDWTLAKVGVSVFAIALLVPSIVYGSSRANTVLVASESVLVVSPADVVSLPNQVAVPRRTLAAPSTAAPAPSAPERAAAAAPAPVPGGQGTVVTASWYGPGFFENRLPCWQWLAARGLPIQLLPDTWGVAHKTLPCGTMLTLTHGMNTITVPVVDRGPYVAGRELDLAPRVKAALACTDICTVVMQLH